MRETGAVTSGRSAFWLFWSAGMVGSLGGRITEVALPLLAITVLNVSNFSAGLLTAAGYVAVVLVGLPGGVLVQHFPLRGLQVSMDLFRAVAVLTIPLAAWLDVLTFVHLLAATFLVGLASNLFDIANASYAPQIIPKDELIARNGLLSGTDAATGLAGPSLGGLLVQVAGAAVGVLINAGTYVASAVLLSRLPATVQLEKSAEETGFSRRIWLGLQFVFRHPVIRPVLLAATAVNFANGAIVAVTAPFLIRTLGLPAGAVGVILAVDGLGSIVGAACTARMARRWGDAKALCGAALAGAILSIAMPLAYTPAAPLIFSLGLGFFGGGVAVLSVLARSHRQTVSPPHLLPRVIASVRFASWSAIPVGAVTAGTLAQLITPRAGLVLACVATLLAPLVLWAGGLHKLRRLIDAEPVISPIKP